MIWEFWWLLMNTHWAGTRGIPSLACSADGLLIWWAGGFSSQRSVRWEKSGHTAWDREERIQGLWAWLLQGYRNLWRRKQMKRCFQKWIWQSQNPDWVCFRLRSLSGETLGWITEMHPLYWGLWLLMQGDSPHPEANGCWLHHRRTSKYLEVFVSHQNSCGTFQEDHWKGGNWKLSLGII